MSTKLWEPVGDGTYKQMDLKKFRACCLADGYLELAQIAYHHKLPIRPMVGKALACVRDYPILVEELEAVLKNWQERSGEGNPA